MVENHAIKANPNKDLDDEFILLSAKYTRIDRAHRTGRINDHERLRQIAQTSSHLLEIIEQLEVKEIELDDNLKMRINIELNSETLSDLSDQRVLIFDIDNTVLAKGTNLAEVQHMLDLFEFFIKKGFHLVFITGNDYNLQKRRVLMPIIKKGLASSVTCFSDGGSRLFRFNKSINDYEDQIDYSSANKIETVDIIQGVFEESLDSFMAVDEHEMLKCPNITEHGRVYYETDRLKSLDLLIYPLSPSAYSNRFIDLEEEIEKRISRQDILSGYQILDKDSRNGSMIIRLKGRTADDDSNAVRNTLTNFFSFSPNFNNLATPELELRGSEDFISQIAIKPFKANWLRIDFLRDFRDRLQARGIGKDYAIVFGGKTTIDVQLKGVNKQLAVSHLIRWEKTRFDPQKMIYFGDEFSDYGNDLPVALMEDHLRPVRVIHVGKKEDTSAEAKAVPGFFVDGNGPAGTLNYLRFLRNELEIG